ncbi:MAG: FliA/WhiG family RNA polymerase sigma factor [Clostridiales bacterium]|nr:FliA/WhiG family RNA polymerase sigma factor [Clostridiales bacterium]
MQKYEYMTKEENQIIKYLPLVENIVDKMVINTRQGMERDDYINLGIIGLMEALEKYNPSLNTSFEHYAKWRIKGAIYDELRKNGSISRSRMDKLNEMYKAKAHLQQILLREPEDEEICAYMKISNDELQSIYEAVYYLSYTFLEETLYVKDDEFTLMEMIVDEEALDPQQNLIDEELKQQLTHAIDKLSEKEKIVLDLYYNKELPLKEIAAILEVSISRVSQIHGKIILKLRKLLSSAES